MNTCDIILYNLKKCILYFIVNTIVLGYYR